MFIDVIALWKDTLHPDLVSDDKPNQMKSNYIRGTSISSVTVHRKDKDWFVAILSNGFKCKSENAAIQAAGLLIDEIKKYEEAEIVARSATYAAFTGEQTRKTLKSL